MTRSVVERWRFLPDMVPSASSRLQATARRAPPPSCPAVSAPRVDIQAILGAVCKPLGRVLSLDLPGRPLLYENSDTTRSPKAAFIPYYFCLHHSKAGDNGGSHYWLRSNRLGEENLIPLSHLSPSIPQANGTL
ncbi:uncharacterized protein LOC113924140 [Zalophus californianus]|uniref:Uncharacterized protein LOC113924140 n=1 Tax=Zalophus californianus TaxID=9704 RepID=A0A6J2DG44_ZALCA|nr:uncharacterized protein LOC113924140 [Zalophus californianus]